MLIVDSIKVLHLGFQLWCIIVLEQCLGPRGMLDTCFLFLYNSVYVTSTNSYQQSLDIIINRFDISHKINILPNAWFHAIGLWHPVRIHTGGKDGVDKFWKRMLQKHHNVVEYTNHCFVVPCRERHSRLVPLDFSQRRRVSNREPSTCHVLVEWSNCINTIIHFW